ncbi:alpha-2-macroglobulin family protein [Hyunsoonleella rubra]
MKHSLFLFMMLFFSIVSRAQSPDYLDLWQQVEKLEADGLPKSALKIVSNIEKLAEKDENHPQIIKTKLYKGKFALVLEEDAQLNIIKGLEQDIASSKFPVKNILESIVANLYWQYFQQNRWRFYNRSKVSEVLEDTTEGNSGISRASMPNDDFRTWDLQTLFEEIHLHFQKSLGNGLMLQQEDLSTYDTLLHEQKDSKIYRPTLFDFLSHNALQFYKTDETHITKPSYKFEIDDPKFLADAKTFSSLEINSEDTTSLQLNALKIYQSLIRFHLNDEVPEALANVNIERIKFVHQHATFADKGEILLETLKSESVRLQNDAVSGLYNFEIASKYYEQGKNYIPKRQEEHRWKAKDAIEICNSVMAKFPKSKGAENCRILKAQIEQQTFRLTSEFYLPIQKDARVLVRYKNSDFLRFKAYKLSPRELEKFGKTYRQEEQWAFIQKLNATRSWENKLKNERDYQQHTTEVLFPKLDNGRYLIVATTRENNENEFTFAQVQVTNLALVETETQAFKIFQIIDRNDGSPIANASVRMTYYKSGSRTEHSKSYTSDQLGQFKIGKHNDWYRNVNLKVTFANEVAYFGDYYLDRYYEDKKETVDYKSFLFTDRSIYRPGQTVHFKSILIKKDGQKSEPFVGETVFATLYNTNGEKVSELDFESNDFGSIAGEFILPNNGLNGQYYIEIYTTRGIRNNHYFSIEEYKRPKFETKFNPITDTFKVNHSVTVKGNALAYAGSNITDAKVVYRVHRKVQYPRWYFWYRPWFQTEPQEIAHGETVTNDKGEFEITFKAMPDQSVDKTSLPIFNYEITADVTDLNGETRSATTIVNVGYHAMTANLSLADRLDKTKKDHQLSIDTKNLNGEFVPAKGVVKIYKLKAPENVLRKRPWPAPDYQTFSKEEFKSLFPHDAYADEHNPNNWEKGELVWKKPFDTGDSKRLKLGKIKKWPSGQYLITLESKDKFGQLVKDETRTTVFSNDDKAPADNELFTITADKNNYNIGDTAQITIGSSAQNVTVTLSVEKDKNIIRTEAIQLNNNKKTITIPVTENDLGGFVVHYSFGVFNSYQSGSKSINVPYPKTDLEIETLTFRDKLQPGTDETWSFKIKGPQGDKVSSELLASMYDASLDQFKPHQWQFRPIDQPNYYAFSSNNANRSFGTRNFRVYQDRFRLNYKNQGYDQWNWFGFYFGNGGIARFKASRQYARVASVPGVQVESNIVEEEVVTPMMVADEADLEESAVVGYGVKQKEAVNTGATIKTEKPNFDNIKIRKNLKETAFFFPQLQTDVEGNVSFSFTTPEALTQWKLQLLAHTKTLESATKSLTAVTQKELMVMPNAPRFLREGDQITISTKIANLSEKALSGEAKLILTDAISGEDITTELVSEALEDTDSSKANQNEASSTSATKPFSVHAKANTQVSWSLSIPDNVQAVQYKILAKAGDFSDGEQNALPVLSNRMLVTETLPMWVKSNETRTFTLDKLKTNTSSTLKHHKLTLEMTSNPAWYAVQALPYLMEYPHDCNEQTFSRYYANALASHIANSNPRIQEVFNQWRNSDALISNLEKNQELKSILIQETPWLRDAQSETEQKKRIALLFDLNKMNNELQSALNKLKANQMPSGAWAWFKGGRENRYITQHIIAGFGHLKKLNVIQSDSEESMISKAINYLDEQFLKEYKDIRKYNSKIDLNKDHLSYTQLHYLYMRSFFPEIKTSKKVDEVMQYYQSQIQKYWLKRPLYAKGVMALVSHRNEDAKTTSKILNSLKETSISSEELGMYWKTNTNSWHWYHAPIETQALLIEAFTEAGGVIQSEAKNLETIDNLKIWLLKNKQTNRWKTTKATTEAVYALLLQGSDWISVTDMVDVVLGGQQVSPSKLENVKVEAGTGYYKTSWAASEITPEMGEVKISKKGNGIAWGGLYWQYFEDLDKISSAETPLSLKKKLFLKTNTDTGEEISEIAENITLKVGDLVRVRIELKSDRPMEFLHMKDMRASGLEPVNVFSQYKWQDGLGYYESTKDASTNFFFDYLPKGVYVFEYDLRVNNSGNMSNGITTIQSMYAPEFSSHSEGDRIDVE